MRNIIRDLSLKLVPPLASLYQHRKSLINEISDLKAQLERSKEEILIYQKSLQVYSEQIHYQYDADWLRVWGKNLKSLNNSRFVEAYKKSVRPGVHIEFRAYVCCWAAEQAAGVPGDFVECGVNEGWFSRTICNYLEFNGVDKDFFLFDTYSGIPADQISTVESDRARLHMYHDCFELTQNHFSPFKRAKLVRGKVPETLNDVSIENVAYLSIDMNIEKPERAAIEFFWPKLSPGAIIVLDDYGFEGYERQHNSMDEFAAQVGVPILTLPTGQGIIIKR